MVVCHTPTRMINCDVSACGTPICSNRYHVHHAATSTTKLPRPLSSLGNHFVKQLPEYEDQLSKHNMASDDAHRGGNLSDMAVSGTKVPNDAGKQNLIPSVPGPDQQAENPQFHNQFINAADQQGATDNANDLPRQFKDTGATGEVITAAGEQMVRSSCDVVC